MAVHTRTLVLVLFTGALLTAPTKSSLGKDGPLGDNPQQARLQSRLAAFERAYAEYEPQLTDQQKRICQAQLRITRAELDGISQEQIINLYRQLQELILEERRLTQDKPVHVWRGNSTLWRVFGIEKPLLHTCFAISQICRDSENMTVKEKVRQIKAQADLSNDYRIRQMVIDLLVEDDKYEDATGYCQNQISDITAGKKKGLLWIYQYELVKVRLTQQRALFEQAMKEQAMDWDDVINLGQSPVNVNWQPWETAKTELQRYVRESPGLAAKCLSLFSSDNPYLGPIGERQEIKGFYESTASELRDMHGSASRESPEGLSSLPPYQPVKVGRTADDRDQAVDAILQERKEIVEELISLIDPVNAEKYSEQTRSAAAYLLGEFRAVEAVPALSQALAEDFGQRDTTDISRYDVPIWTALVKIGRPAVPAMIENIEGSDNNRLMTRSVDVLNHVLGGKRRVLELLSKLKERAKDEKKIERIEGALKYAQEYKEDEEPLY